MSYAGRNVLLVELNEFNVELLTSATTQYSFPALSKLLTFSRSHYKTNDRYNSGYLEPWVQWVSIHAGAPSSSHGIKHLGDVPDLHFEQCWETLSKHHISTGVWGVMNGAKRNAEVPFFLPDPWTFSESGFPNELNHLLDLPRYVSKNYQQLSKTALIWKAFKLVKFICRSGKGLSILKETLKLWKPLHKFGYQHFIFISYFDYISTLLFTQYKLTYQPNCAILFLNSLAHLQHHHWEGGAHHISPEILFGLQYIEKIFSLLFSLFPQDAMVVHNGLSQMNTNHEKPWVLYRQKDPIQFLKKLSVLAVRVEQHMTHDGHVFFNSVADCDEAYTHLKAATLNNKPLFHVEKNAFDPLKLFYQLNFTDPLASNAEFTFNGKQYAFFQHFDQIVTRTGRHIPIGTIFSNSIPFPDHIDNHDFNKYLFHYLLPSEFSLRENIEQEIFAEDAVC